MRRKRGGQSALSQSVVTFLLRCKSGPREHSKSSTEAWVGLKAVPGIYNYCNEHRFVLRTHCWAQDTCKKPPKRYKQLWQWKSDSKWQSVSILSNIHCGRWLVKCISHNSEGQRPPKQRRPRLQKWYTLFALSGSTQHCSGSVHGRKKLPVMIPAAIPLQTILRLFIFFPSSFSVCVHHMTVSLSSSTTDEGFWSSQGRVGAGCSASGTWSSCADDGTEFSETEPFFTYPGRLRWPLTGTGPSLVVRWRDSGPLAVTLVTLVCDTIGP